MRKPQAGVWIKNNIPFLFGIIAQTLSFIWWASSLNARVQQHDKDIAAIRSDYVPRAQIEQGQEDIKDELKDMKGQLNILLARPSQTTTTVEK